MDYEQKYKEALSRARIVNPGTKDYNIVTTIFPELKKSDDKRIRENAIQIIRYSMGGTDVALPLSIYKECIAWLEKQGEQKQVSITDKWIEDYWQHEKVNNPNSYDKGDEIQFDHDGFVRFCKKYCQKPIWSAEDENMFACLYGIPNWVERSNHSSAKNVGEYIEWLQSLKQRLNGYE